MILEVFYVFYKNSKNKRKRMFSFILIIMINSIFFYQYLSYINQNFIQLSPRKLFYSHQTSNNFNHSLHTIFDKYFLFLSIFFMNSFHFSLYYLQYSSHIIGNKEIFNFFTQNNSFKIF